MANDDPTASGDELGSMASMLHALADTPSCHAPLEAGTRFADKYVIVRELGRGGMGVVYLARDARLDREVALKLSTAPSTAALARADREARVLAKLSHPNVVVVYEVGEDLGRLFVAMEYVDGGTARTWLADSPRTWRAIVALYAAAGDGLTAAHAVGIVHRDFKPDNILVGADGRPRVADFGLALASPDDRAASSGTIGGTPAYMAPEQRDATIAIDERADQFAFCVGLWEALYGTRPTEGLAPPNRGVPSFVVEVLRRGLADAPAARWPTVAELVRGLRADPAVRRRRIALAGAGALVLGGAVTIAMVARRDADPCANVAAEFAGTWNPTRAAALHAAVHAADGDAAWPAITQRLDGYAASWIDADRAACRAPESTAMHDKRTACLHRARTRFGVVVDALASGKAGVAHAPQQLGLLAELDGCANIDALARESDQPTDVAMRATIAELDKKLFELQSQLTLDAPMRLADADALVAATTATGWSPIIASAEVLRGNIQSAVGDPKGARATLEAAAAVALGAGDDATAADAMVDLAWALARSGRFEESLRWDRLAAALNHRIGDPPSRGAHIADAEAMALEAGPNPATSLPVRQRAAVLADRVFTSPIGRAYTRLNLAVGYRASARYDDAERELRNGLAIVEGALGKDHPAITSFMLVEGEIAGLQGRLDDADAANLRGLALAEHWYSNDVPVIGQLLFVRSGVLQRRGKLDEALSVALRALAIAENHEPDSESTGQLEGNVGIIYALQNKLDDSTRHAERAQAILEGVWGKDNPMLVPVVTSRGWVARARGDLDGSMRFLEHAVALADGGEDLNERVNTRIELSYTLVKAHRASRAAAELESVAAIAKPPAVEPRIAAEFHLAFADALYASGNATRAHAEAVTSRAAWATLGDDFADSRAGADAWLAAH